MAGIGFRLRALATEGSYAKATAAYASSAIISAGPWIAGVAALAALRGVSASFLRPADHDLLFATLVVIFAASLLLSGGPQMIITRYLADRLYVEDTGAIAPTALGSLALLLPLSLIALPFVLWAPFDLRYRLLVATMFLALTMNWLLMVFVSASRDHWRVVTVLCSGYAISIALAVGLGYPFGLLGTLGGFTLGQATEMALLMFAVCLEFPSRASISFDYLSYLGPYWLLGLIGLCYMAGIWADNVVFWFAPGNVAVQHFYHLFPPNDTAKFFVTLLTIPSSAFFLVHLETRFYGHYRDFFRFIERKQPLGRITQAREGMIAAVNSGVIALVKLQGLVSLFMCIVASQVTAYLGLTQQWATLLRVESFGAGAQFFTLVMLLLLLYLDQRRDALLVAATFLIGNAGLALLTVYMGQQFYGGGYLVAAVVSALLGWILLRNRLKRIEFDTFMSQPL